MLTPQDIEKEQFKTRRFGNGYDMDMVDQFLDRIYKDYSALYKENNALKGKMKVLLEKIEEYKSVDEAMRKALLVAQNMANDLISGARRQSEELTLTAKQEAERRIESYRDKAEKERQRLDEAKNSTAAFIDGQIESYKRELERLNAIRNSDNCSNNSTSTSGTIQNFQQGSAASKPYLDEKTAKIEDLSEAISKSLQMAQGQLEEKTPAQPFAQAQTNPINFFQGAGDPGVAVPNTTDTTAEFAKVYTIELNQERPSHSIQGDLPDPNAQSVNRKFSNLKFGHLYQENEEDEE